MNKEKDKDKRQWITFDKISGLKRNGNYRGKYQRSLVISLRFHRHKQTEQTPKKSVKDFVIEIIIRHMPHWNQSMKRMVNYRKQNHHDQNDDRFEKNFFNSFTCHIFYLNFFLCSAFFASIACFTANRFFVLCDRVDFLFGLSVVPLFAIN